MSWQYTGTHSKGELFGMAPANKKVAVKGISLLEFDKGLVVKESGIVDNMSLLAQIGAIRLPAS